MGVLVGKPAPDFTCNAVLGDGSIVSDFNLAKTIKGKYALVFFYPLDFTFVCPTELHAFQEKLKDLNFQLSQFQHLYNQASDNLIDLKKEKQLLENKHNQIN